jgi:hypothetical protein
VRPALACVERCCAAQIAHHDAQHDDALRAVKSAELRVKADGAAREHQALYLGHDRAFKQTRARCQLKGLAPVLQMRVARQLGVQLRIAPQQGIESLRRRWHMGLDHASSARRPRRPAALHGPGHERTARAEAQATETADELAVDQTELMQVLIQRHRMRRRGMGGLRRILGAPCDSFVSCLWARCEQIRRGGGVRQAAKSSARTQRGS